MKAVVKMPCEDGNCKHNHDMLVDLDELGVKIQNKEIPSANITKIPEMQINNIPKPEPEQPKKLTHDELASFIPKGINSMKCPGGDCGHQKIKNPKQTKKYKSCPHCSANTLPKGSDSCPYCSKNIDEDQELDDGIELESEEEDE